MTSNIAQRRITALDEGTPGYRARRQELVDAAARAFKRKGYRATSLGDIAAEAGTDRATLYYYVSGKAELLDEAVSSAVEANSVAAEEIRKGPQPATEKIRMLITSLMASYAENFPYLYVFVQENLSQVAADRLEWSHRMRVLNHRYQDALIGIITDGIDEGSLRSTGDPTLMAYGVLGMLGWTNRWFNPNEGTHSAAEIASTFADMVLSGMTAALPADHEDPPAV